MPPGCRLRRRGSQASRLPGTAGTRNDRAAPAVHSGWHGDRGVRAGGAALARPGLARGAPGCPPAGTGARPGCAARSSPCWPGSRSTTSPGSNRAGRPTPRSRSSRPWAGPCGCRRPSASTCSSWPGWSPPGPGTVPAYITPSVQRMLDRLTGTPVAVSDAAWTLLLANPLYTALMGEPSDGAATSATRVWRNFLGSGRPGPPHTAGPARARGRAGRRPARGGEPLSGRPAAAPAGRGTAREQRPVRRAVGLGTVGRHEASRKTIDHPQVGP